MALKYVTFTGVDNYTDMHRLEDIAIQYPMVEFAILIMPQKEGTTLYPNERIRQNFYEANIPNKAIHLCGTALNQFASRDPKLLKEISYVNRVQLNIIPQTTSVHTHLIAEVVQQCHTQQFITQRNKLTQDFYSYWKCTGQLKDSY